MNNKLNNKIAEELKKSKQYGLTFKQLCKSCNISTKDVSMLRKSIDFLEKSNIIIDARSKIYHTSCINIQVATVVKLNKTFGFVKLICDDSQIFVPGKFFIGALPGDEVLIKPIKSRGESPEGEIIKITKYGVSEFVGTVKVNEQRTTVIPDTLMKDEINIITHDKPFKDNDKVLCQIITRGKSHSEHTAKIIKSYGNSQFAHTSAMALLHIAGTPVAFPPNVLEQSKEISKLGINIAEFKNRCDLRNDNIFTIDGEDTKDIDDAISIKKFNDFYELSVHIADVAHYVKPNSPIDQEAFERGTSIYYANNVIPMLPKELSNGICSLNPNEERLAFSCIMTIDKNGLLNDFHFKKTIIKSKVKGVYSEINKILTNTHDESIKLKYQNVLESILLMKELANILTKNKVARGSPQIETNESKIIVNEQNIAFDIKKRERGEAEVIIEEFMLVANQAAATAARLKDMPFIYRVHEEPSEKKIEFLKELLSALGFSTVAVKKGMAPSVLSDLLEQSKNSPLYPLINIIILRSMSKAKYFEKPLGHYGLALENYAQFTSPIRRYPDLVIHRVLSDIVSNIPLPKTRTKFESYVAKAALQSTTTEIRAMNLERDCNDCYKAEYMKQYIGENFSGIISSIAPHGIYVELENTIEGLIRLENMPAGKYDINSMLLCKNLDTEKSYRIGDNIDITCISCDVSSGKIDFKTLDV